MVISVPVLPTPALEGAIQYSLVTQGYIITVPAVDDEGSVVGVAMEVPDSTHEV